jgi:hypothetical protein
MEAHPQVSPEEESCDFCVVNSLDQTTGQSAIIKPFQDYFIVFLDNGEQKNCCEEHIATLQQLYGIEISD